MNFPDVKFGICQVCNADGRDQTAELTSADAPARVTSGNGIVLEEYLGKLMCNACINIAKSDKESLQSAKKHAEAERFRAKAGFITTVPQEV